MLWSTVSVKNMVVACMAEALRQGVGYEFGPRVVVLFLQSLLSSTPACITLTDNAYHRTDPQGMGSKWSQHCGPPMTVYIWRLGMKNRGHTGGLHG